MPPEAVTPVARRALVTGAARRLGREIALALARAGWDVAVHHGESADAARQTVADIQALGRRAVAVRADLADPAQTAALFDAASAAPHGKRIKAQGGSVANLGYWDDPTDWASWKVLIAAPGKYEVTARASSLRKENQFVVELAGQKLTGKAPQTESWDDYKTIKLGKVELSAGQLTVTIHPQDPKWTAINLHSLTLRPAK